MSTFQSQLAEIRGQIAKISKLRSEIQKEASEMTIPKESFQTVKTHEKETVTLSIETPEDHIRIDPEQKVKYTRSIQTDEFTQEVTEAPVFQPETEIELAMTNQVDIPLKTEERVYKSGINPVNVIPGEGRNIPTSCCWSGDKLLVSFTTDLTGNGKGVVKYYDEEYQSTEFTIPSQPTVAVFLPHSSEEFIVGCTNGNILLYNVSDREPIAQSCRWMKGCHKAPIVGVEFYKDKEFTSVSSDGKIKFWNTNKLAAPQSYEKNNSNAVVRPTAITSNELGQIIFGYEDGSLLLRKQGTPVTYTTIHQFNSTVTALDYAKGKNGLAAVSIDGTAKVWSKGSLIRDYKSVTESYVNCCWQSPGSPNLALFRSDNTIQIADVTKDKSPIEYKMSSMVRCCGFNSDGTLLCCGCLDGSISILSLEFRK